MLSPDPVEAVTNYVGWLNSHYVFAAFDKAFHAAVVGISKAQSTSSALSQYIPLY